MNKFDAKSQKSDTNHTTMHYYPRSLINLFSQDKLKADPKKIRQIKNRIYEILEIEPEITISISQLQYSEPRCPAIETVIAIMTTPAQQYKIHKTLAEIDCSDIFALIQLIN